MVRFRIPRGFRIGAVDTDVRMPAPTRVEVTADDCFEFGEPQFPDPLVRGVPVKLGMARIYEGEVRGVIPFEVRSDCGSGEHAVRVLLTYTPAVSAGQLSTHVKEPYEVLVQTSGQSRDGGPGSSGPAETPTKPALASMPEDFFVEERPVSLPVPLNMMMRRLSENGAMARMLHTVFVDPPNHGKHIQVMPHPYVADSDNNGYSAGAALSLITPRARGRLRQMLIDLLSNTVKFTDRGEVKVLASSSAGGGPAAEKAHLIFAVSDTGKGIPEEEIVTIFDEHR